MAPSTNVSMSWCQAATQAVENPPPALAARPTTASVTADLATTNLVNRGRIEHVYGFQNEPRTVSGIEKACDGCVIVGRSPRDH